MVIFTLTCGYCGCEWRAMFLTRECPECKEIGKIAVKEKEENDD